MFELSGLRRETRYGMPAADQILFNRFFVTGYSYYFRQAKWALEIIDSNAKDVNIVERIDNFRPDMRIPMMFRTALSDYRHSGYDRGHLVASANHQDEQLQNSETFLLSNMSPQKPGFNQKIWRELEHAIRELDARDNILETFVICGPIFDFNLPVQAIGVEDDDNEVSIPIPHAFFKSILTENDRGRFDVYSFIIPNKETDKDVSTFLKPTIEVEYKAGIFLWDKLSGTRIDKEKYAKGAMW